MKKHTPAPWKITKWERENCVDGFETVITDSHSHGIVTFHQKGHNEKVVANARLIAAAPDLLDACERAHKMLTKYQAILIDLQSKQVPAIIGSHLRPISHILSGAISRAK